MTILAALITVALTAAFVTGCTAHRVMRIDERIVLVPASAAPAGLTTTPTASTRGSPSSAGR